MGCVNINHPEFINLTKKHNVHSTKLELITHKYWKETGNETLFPTDLYIQNELGLTQYQESGNSVRKIWELRYNTPQEYPTTEALNEAKKEASKYFPQSAIVSYPNAKDTYTLTIKQPVAHLNNSKDSFFENYDGADTFKNLLRRAYNIKEWAYRTLTDDQLKEAIIRAVSEDIDNISNSQNSIKINPQYKGKLIYAQSGTGKTTIADNKTIIDSDYILGNILGVSTETAGFFFKTLSADQKKIFGEKYREAIKKEVARGHTVLTANLSMIEDADIIVYNKTAEQTNERVNNKDRSINNRYSALDYHKSTLEKINTLKQQHEGIKTFFPLSENQYLSDIIYDNLDNNDNISINQRQRSNASSSSTARGELKREYIIKSFLDNFGISTKEINEYDGDLPLFDALNRVINYRSPEDITDGVGYAIAFMMQADPEMQYIIMRSHGLYGGYNSKFPIPIPGRGKVPVNQITRGLFFKKTILKEIGRQIAEELRTNYDSLDLIQSKSVSKNSILSVIKKFFVKLATNIITTLRGIRVSDINAKKNLFISDIIEALGREDFSRIKGPQIKPGTFEKAQKVNIEKALLDNPFEDSIIQKLGNNGIALAGSASIALQGSLYRPTENPLHDIDFNAGNNSSKESLDILLPTIFDKNTIHFSSIIKKPHGNDTVTYITLDTPFVIKNNKRNSAEYYSLDGKYLGRRYKYSELELEPGVKGKLLDFFVGPTQEDNYGFYKREINGKEYLISNSNAAMSAKILWGRDKDMWDYKNFKANNSNDNIPTQFAISDNLQFAINNTPININAGTNENADLSNLASRPFSLQVFENEAPITFNSVEQAFQYIKFRLLKKYLGFDEYGNKFLLSKQPITGEKYRDNTRSYVKPGVKAANLKANITGLTTIGEDTYESALQEIDTQIDKILKAKNGFEAKKLGGKNGGYTINGNSGNTFLDTIWNYGEIVSEDAMKEAIKASFEQNPQALQRLLSTGNATLTHTQAKEPWKTSFPELLMEVRAELAKENGVSLSNNSTSDTTIDYTPTGKQRQTYTIKGSHIYNKEGKEVFKEDSVDRNKIFANLAVKQGRAVVVNHKGTDYVVNNRQQIISTKTGKVMQWGEENGDRKAILSLAKDKFSDNQSSPLTTQLIDHLKSIGLNVLGRAEMEEFLKKNNVSSLQQFIEDAPEELKDFLEEYYRDYLDYLNNIDSIEEIESIKKEAIKKGTFMKAPNGEPTNLTEKQWLVVRTKAFKDWFGDWEKEYTPQENSYKENPWERYMETEDTGRTMIGYSGKRVPIIVKKGVKYAHPVERVSPTQKDPFGFNSFNINKLIIPGQEVDADRPFNGICQSTAHACKDFLKNRYGIESSIEIIFAESPVKDDIIDHWVNILSIDGEPYIYDMPQTEYIKRTAPLKYRGEEISGYYEGIISSAYKPRLIKVTEENLSKYYSDNGKNDKRIKVIKDTVKRLNKAGNSVSLSNLNYKQAYSNNVSKVVDENGEPLVVYHGSKSNKITIFDSTKSEARQSLSNRINPTNFFSSDPTVADFFAVTENQILASAISRSISIILDAYAGKEVPAEIIDDDIWTEAARRTGKSKEFVKNFWETKVPEEYKIHDEFGNSRMKDSTIEEYKYGVFLNLKNPTILDAKGQRADKFIENNQEVLNSNDEVIINNINETVGKQDTATDYLVKNPNQIKSATKNIGTFSTTDNNIEKFITPQGEVYGFVDKDGNIYLDETVISPEHPIHEYTHLWDRAVAKNNPELWKRGVTLMKTTSIWKEVLESDNYGKQWQSMKGMTQDKLESLIASEVHSRLTGEKGKELLNKEPNKKLVNHLKQWLKDFFNALKETFSKWTDKDLSNLKVEDFVNMTLRDLADGINPNSIKSLQDTINGMSAETLRKDLQTIEQENNDYDIIHGTQTNKRGPQSKIPQSFTFNDGVKVQSPFKPNSQQIDALNAMSDFVKSNETSMTLSGYAGTGKTSIMEMLAKKMKQQHKRVAFCASTNKAAAVLNARVSKAGFSAGTLNKLFGISVEIDTNQKHYNVDNLVNKLKDEIDLDNGTTVIIDEASMINDENYEIINRIAKERNLKIIYVGDEAQLSPVNQKDISKVFSNGDGKVVRLTQVERTDDNAILKEATDIRDGKSLSGTSSFNDNGEGVAYISPQNTDTINAIINRYIKGLKDNPEYFRILAYTNRAVTAYNTQVRQSLGITSNTPQKGEPMMGYNNWGYKYGKYRFINSEAYKVKHTGRPTTISMVAANGTKVYLEAIPLTLVDSFGKEDTFDYIDIKNNPKNREVATILAQEKSALWAKVKHMPKGSAKANVHARINEIEKFLFVNDNIIDPVNKTPDGKDITIQKKVIDFGYAMTVHKSQGSTFTHVLMDDVDIIKGILQGDNTPIPQVELSEEDKKTVKFTSDMSNASEVIDLGDLSTATETNIPSPKAKLKSQLEYVAVSRATDTVSIISNNVKVEDSPLKHQKKATVEVASATSPNINQQSTVNNNDTIKKIKKTEHQIEETLGSGTEAKSEIKDAIKVAQKGISFEEALANQEAIFTKEEQQQIKSALNGKNLKVMSVSRQTDPVFFSKEIVSFLESNSKKAFTDPTRINAIEIWSKHDGMPIQDILEACKKYKVAPMMSFSITGLGGTALEGGVMKYNDLLDKIEELIKAGSLNPVTTTVRIDPILVGVTNMEDIKTIVNRAKSLGIKKFVTSLVQSYGYTEGTSKDRKVVSGINTALASEGKTYDWDKYYGRDYKGKINFKPKQQYIDEIGKVLLELDSDPNITIQTCAFGIKGLKVSACLDPLIIERITGVDVLRKDGTYDRDTSRPECMCYGAHSDMFRFNEKKCFSSCAYCYAAHSGDNKLNYYNEDGTLKNNPYTQVATLNNSSATTTPVGTASAVSNLSPSTQSQKVSLPSYEYFRDLYEDTTVDAAWKIPYLKELDAQLSAELTPEQTNTIIQQMDDILQATSETEYNQQLKASETNDSEKIQKDFNILSSQYKNLIGEKARMCGLTASEVSHTAEMIVNTISDEITELQTKEGHAQKIFPTLNTTLDFKTATRRQIVETVGLDTLIKRAKDLFSPKLAGYRNPVLSIQAQLIYENWDQFIQLGAATFELNEGFGIKRVREKSSFDVSDSNSTPVEIDNYNGYDNDVDRIAEEEGKDEQEHWQIENKTIDNLHSMSYLVRQALHQCYEMDENNKPIHEKWSTDKRPIYKRVNPRTAMNQIYRWTQGSLNINDMITRLSNKQVKNPWLSQLIERLSDKSGKEADFQSLFYGVFAKHFQPYSIVLLEDGTFKSVPVNDHPAVQRILRDMNVLFKIGQHPMFSASGLLTNKGKKLLGTNATTSKESDFNLHKALLELTVVNNSLKNNSSTEDLYKTAVDNIVGVCRSLGFYDISEEVVAAEINNEGIATMTKELGNIVRVLDTVLQAQNDGRLKGYNPYDTNNANSINTALRKFLTPITDRLEDSAVNAFYDSGKMYQSFVTPSFMSKLMVKFRQTGQAFEDFLEEEYGSSEWYKTQSGKYGEWRTPWLNLFKTEKFKDWFDHKVELNFNKHNYMRNMSPEEYTLSMITEYFSEFTSDKESTAPAWYRMPMQSNKPSSEFIKFVSYRGSNYKSEIVKGLHAIFMQELSRIQTVNMRNLSKGMPGFIKNFDTNGRKFNFLPVLNQFLEKKSLNYTLFSDYNTAEDNANLLSTLLQVKINSTVKPSDKYSEYFINKDGAYSLNSKGEKVLADLIKEVLFNSTQQRVNAILEEWQNSGIIEAATKVKGIYPSKEKFGKELSEEEKLSFTKDNIENFLWNDSFASKNILQLTIGDIAFYKDTEDLQKRLAQLHAPGIRANIYATDYKGNRVSDEKYRTFILKDFDNFRSNIIANISEVFDRKIANAPESQRPALEALKDSLVRKPKTNDENDKGGKYWNINVTDAQGYSSPSSYRKKAFMFGRWSQKAEDLYQRFLSGNASYTDLEVAFQPLKPFVYSRMNKEIGVTNSPIQSMQVPFQAKNAEYLLIMADAILQGEELSRPNLLRAVYRAMEDSAYTGRTYKKDANGKLVIDNPGKYNGKGIDTVQFESAIKSSLQGAIDITSWRNVEGGEEGAYTQIMNSIYSEEFDKDENRVYNNYNTKSYVHETSFEDYCLQQEVPAHFKDHSQSHGSQIRMIIPSDLDFYTTDENGQQVENFYEFDDYDKDGNKIHKKLKANEFRKEYEENIAEGIEESIEKLRNDLALNTTDRRLQNIALSNLLIKEIESNPSRYGVDLMYACSLNENGEFRIPKGDPIQAKRIEQLINSIIKSRVNKQKIAGGPIVQVSNFGTSKQLQIRFNDKQGKLLPLESEYNPAEHNNLPYSEFIKKNQGGIAHFEVFAPAWSNDILEKFSNPDGTIDIDAIKATDTELLKMVSYRIPTEDKYSCAPMMVVGFMPKEAGDAIMLPYELTEIDDSDFDVDKRYVMNKVLPIVLDTKKLKQPLVDYAVSDYTKKNGQAPSKETLHNIKTQVSTFLMNRGTKDKPFYSKFEEFLENAITEIAKTNHYIYKTMPPKKGKLYRDNKTVDMSYSVLSNQQTADKILNPGGFDAPKKIGYMVAAYKNANGYSWKELQQIASGPNGIDKLKELSYTDKDLTYADTQVQFYKQNSAAASLIGMFAVGKIAHATLEGNDIYVDIKEVCGEETFSIAEFTFADRMQLDPRADTEGNLIGKTLGSLVSASADAVKDPILNLINVNTTTADMLNAMLRLGMTFDKAALFLSQNIIEKVLDKFNRENLTGFKTLDNIIQEHLDAYSDENGTKKSVLNTEPLSTEELIEGLTSEEHSQIDYKVLLAFQKIKALTSAIRKPTFATRFNSISAAVGPLIVDNLIIEHKMEEFLESENSTNFYTSEGDVVDITNVFKKHPILKQFARTVDIAKGLFRDMPAGSTGFRNLLNTLAGSDPTISKKMYSDKKLLDKLSTFYQSYLAVQSGLINPDMLKSVIEDFPSYFTQQHEELGGKTFKELYPDNALIQAIQMGIDSNNKKYLSTIITGKDETEKDRLRNAWIDLHYDNPELSRMLFVYSFFRGGIGFSPKTFMALIPSYVKERLTNSDGSVSYIDTYRKFPSVVPGLVIDQFFRNNWNDNKLVPRKDNFVGKGNHNNLNLKEGTLEIVDPKDIEELGDLTYIKTKIGKNTYLWRLVTSEKGKAAEFELIQPLGNNGEYLEISTSDIQKSITNTTQDKASISESSELKDQSPSEADNSSESTITVSDTEKTKALTELEDLLMMQNPKFNRVSAHNKIEDIKKDPKPFAKFLVNVYKHKGLELTPEGALEEFNKLKLC